MKNFLIFSKIKRKSFEAFSGRDPPFKVKRGENAFGANHSARSIWNERKIYVQNYDQDLLQEPSKREFPKRIAIKRAGLLAENFENLRNFQNWRPGYFSVGYV